MVDTYDPKSVLISYGNKSIKDGIADGTFLTVTRTARTRSVRVGSDSGATIEVNPDRSAVVQITYRASSQTNNILNDMRAGEDLQPAGFYPVGTLTVEYTDGGVVVTDDNAFIDGPPDVTYSTGEETRTWTIVCPRSKMDVRGTVSPPRIGDA